MYNFHLCIQTRMRVWNPNTHTHTLLVKASLSACTLVPTLHYTFTFPSSKKQLSALTRTSFEDATVLSTKLFSIRLFLILALSMNVHQKDLFPVRSLLFSSPTEENHLSLRPMDADRGANRSNLKLPGPTQPFIQTSWRLKIHFLTTGVDFYSTVRSG